MTTSHSTTAIEGIRDTAEYSEAKRLFYEKRELQARMREVNSSLRLLQLRARMAVDLARDDLRYDGNH